MTRPIAVLSDIHIGDGGPRDTSAPNLRPESFCRMLDWIKERRAELVLAGDILELYACSLDGIVRKHGKILDLMSRRASSFIYGNHDGHYAGLSREWMPGAGEDPRTSTPRRLFDLYCGPMVYQQGKRRVLVCHGNEGDRFCENRNPGIDNATAIASAIKQDRGRCVYADDALRRVSRVRRVVRRLRGQPTVMQEHIGNMRDEMERWGCDVVVCGHTHTPGFHGGWYCNSGFHCRTRDTFAWIDCAGEVRVMEWTGTDVVEVNDVICV